MKQSVQMSPKQLLDRLYNNAWETKNWQLTRSSKKTLITGVAIIIAAGIAANKMSK